VSIRTNFQILLNKIESEKRAVLNELDFDDKEEFKEYADDHKIRDTTKVTIDGKKMQAGDVDKEKKTSSPKMEKTLNRVEDAIKDIKDPVQKENAESVLQAMEVFNNPDSSMENKLKAIEDLNSKGLIFMNSATAKQKKMYLDPSLTGLDRKALVDPKQKGSPKEMQKAMEEYGFDKIKPEGGKISSGDMMITKLFEKDKISKIETKVTKDGMTLGKSKIEKSKIPSDEVLLKAYGGDKEKAKLAKKTLLRRNKIIEKAQDAFKDGGLEIVEPVPGTPPNTPENRKKLKDATSDKIAEGFEAQFKKTGRKPTPTQQKVIDDLKGLKDIKDQKEYDKELHRITEEMFKDPFYDGATKNVVEMTTYMSELNKGNEVYMPAKSNYPLGDVISISPEKIDWEKDSPEEIQKKLQLINHAVEARSIKKGAGGASASGVKTDQSEFKDITNKKGKKILGKELKGDLSELSDKNKIYSEIYDGDSSKAENSISEIAEKYDFDLDDPKLKERREKSVESALNNIKNSGKCDDDFNEAATKKNLENYYNLGNMYQDLYNDNVTEQLFVNEQYKYTKTNGLEVNRTDGISKMAKLKFQFSSGGWSCEGRPSNTIPTKFVNEK